MTTTPPPASLRIILAAAIFLGSAAASAPGKVVLRWKFRAGEVLRYQTDQTTASKAKDPGGQEVNQTVTLTVDLAWTVKAVDPSGTATLTQTIDRMRTTATTPHGKMAFDSRDAAAASSPAGPIFKMLVGSEITFTMNPRGEIGDIKLSDKLLASFKGDEPAGAQGQFSEVGLKNMVAQMGVAFPEEGLDVGGTWTRKLAVPAGPDGQTRDVAQTYTFRGPAPAGGIGSRIDLATRFEPIKPDPNFPVTIKAEQADGRVDFDDAKGRIEVSRITQRVDVTSRIEGKEYAMSTESVTTMTLAKDKAP